MNDWILPVFWLALALVMLIAEIATVSLVSIWFVAGAALAFVLALFQTPLWLQIAVFAMVSILLFVTLKDRIQEFFRFRHEKSGAFAVLGQEGLVIETIDPIEHSGRVKIAGQDWKASARQKIEQGSRVKAVSLNGVTLQVVRMDAAAGKENL